MKSEYSQPKRYIQNGLKIYSSGTLHHQKNSVRGFLYKRPQKEKFFQLQTHYKRYFVVTNKQSFIQMQEQPVTKIYKQIKRKDIVCIQKISQNSANFGSNIPWKFSFELNTTERIFELFAPTVEERDLWVNGLHRILNIPVNDIGFVPMQMSTKQDIEFSDDFLMTDGNVSHVIDNTVIKKEVKLETVEEEKWQDTNLSAERPVSGSQVEKKDEG